MKHWFKYQTGYVNIDDEHIYLTNTGNWSETAKLQEKSTEPDRAQIRRATRIKFFMAMVFLMFAILLWNMLRSGELNLLLCLLVLFGGYSLYIYMRTEVGPAFRIPREKLISIGTSEQDLTLGFYNNENAAEQFLVSRLSKEGLAFFRQMAAAVDQASRPVTPEPENSKDELPH